MSDNVFINQKIRILETCSPLDVSKHCIAILESFLVLEKPMQKELAEELNTWAEKNAKHRPLLFAYAKLIFGYSYFSSEQFDTALPLLTEARDLFTQQDDKNGAAICTILTGSIYRTFGNVDLSLNAFWSGYEQLKHEELFQHFFIACTINLGGIYSEMKHDDEAIPLFKSALEMAEPHQKYYWVIYALHGLGKIYVAQKKYTEAKECLEKAMVAAEKFSNPVSLCNSLSEFGNYYFATGVYLQAEQYHKQALALREQNQFTGGAITSCIRLGEIFIRDSKPGEAIAVLSKGLVLAEQVGVKLKMYQLHLLLSEIYQGKNDLEKSLFHYKQFHELRDQVEVEDSARKLKNAQTIFTAEQTKKENTIIKKQKEEIEKKNIELQHTIDELTRARIGKKARAITLMIAIVLFVLEDFILHFALLAVPENNYFISMIVKIVIIFSLSPINKAIENYLLKKVVRNKMNVIPV
jgi:tetratricopeptide (TPR) repeat protein